MGAFDMEPVKRNFTLQCRGCVGGPARCDAVEVTSVVTGGEEEMRLRH